MSKIKKIEISDFRIYQDKQVFSFESGQGLSNLLFLYAPNGFGKTSFFDAVEWCYADSIRRFKNEYTLAEINRRDYSSGDKILITNRTSYKQGKKGEVRIETADEKHTKRVAKIRKITGQNFKYDYLPGGDLTGNFGAHELDSLTNTNFLTQDQIDAFLRNTTPEQKFHALSEFWPEGATATDTFKRIDSYKNILFIEINEINERLRVIDEEVTKYLNAAENIGPVNEAIAELTKSSQVGFKLEQIAESVNDAFFKSLLDGTQGYIKRIGNLIASAQSRAVKLQELSGRLEMYAAAEHSRSVLVKEIAELTALEKLYTDLRSTRQLLVERETSVTAVIATIKKVNELMKFIANFIALRKNIFHHQELIRELYEGNEAILSRVFVYTESYQNLQRLKDTSARELNVLREDVSGWDDNHSGYLYWMGEHTAGTKEQEGLDTANKALAGLIETLETRRQLLTNVLVLGEYGDLEEPDTTQLKERMDAYNLLGEQFLEVDGRIKKLVENINQSESLDDTLDKIVTWGKDYIEKTDAGHCPLCASNFDSAFALLERVTLQKTGTSRTAPLQKELEALREEQDRIEKARSDRKVAIEDYLKLQILLCNNSMNGHQLEMEKLSKELREVNYKVIHAKEMADAALAQLVKRVPPDTFTEPNDLPAIKQEQTERLAALEKSMVHIDSLLLKEKAMIDDSNNLIITNRNNAFGFENVIALSKADPILIAAETLMESLQLNGDNVDKALLERMLKENNTEKETLDAEIGRYRAHLEDLQYQITTNAIQLPEESIAGNKLIKEGEKQGQERHLTDFRTTWQVLVAKEIISKEELADIIQANQAYLEKLQKEHVALTELEIRLELVRGNVTKNSLEMERIKLNEKLPTLIKALELVSGAKDTASNYIQKEINNYFNKDIINQIYSRIEPHPNLNRIDFELEMTERGPVLDVKAVSKEENLNPVLYLSAGQLNILSLSIFLAKAFEVGNDKISTIFMDDPIQNLSDINVLSFIDLIRQMITSYDRQLVISTHDENFYKLMRHKMPPEAFNVNYYTIESYGKVNKVNS
jgi:exonuclease SbcC